MEKKASSGQTKEYFKQYREKHREEINARERIRQKKKYNENPEAKRKSWRDKYYRNRLKNSIRTFAYKAIKIPTGTICKICHINPAVCRHHPDYNKPLEVLLLCKDCHYKIHRMDKERGIDMEEKLK